MRAEVRDDDLVDDHAENGDESNDDWQNDHDRVRGERDHGEA